MPAVDKILGAKPSALLCPTIISLDSTLANPVKLILLPLIVRTLLPVCLIVPAPLTVSDKLNAELELNKIVPLTVRLLFELSSIPLKSSTLYSAV